MSAVTFVAVDDVAEVDRVRRVVETGSLVESIGDVGLLQPIVVTDNGTRVPYRLVAGGRRLAAVRRLGWTHVPAHVVDGLDDAAALLRAERDENTQRHNLLPSELADLASRLEAIEKPKAKERQRAGGGDKKSPEAKATAGGKLPQPIAPKAKVRDVVADHVGVSGRTVDKAKAVVAAARNESLPDAVRDVAKAAVEEMDRTGKIDPAFQKVRDAAAEAGIAELQKKIDESDVGIRRKWSTAVCRTRDGLMSIDPDAAVRAVGLDHRLPMRMFVEDLAKFAAAMLAALDAADATPLTVMEGGKR